MDSLLLAIPKPVSFNGVVGKPIKFRYSENRLDVQVRIWLPEQSNCFYLQLRFNIDPWDPPAFVLQPPSPDVYIYFVYYILLYILKYINNTLIQKGLDLKNCKTNNNNTIDDVALQNELKKTFVSEIINCIKNNKLVTVAYIEAIHNLIDKEQDFLTLFPQIQLEDFEQVHDIKKVEAKKFDYSVAVKKAFVSLKRSNKAIRARELADFFKTELVVSASERGVKPFLYKNFIEIEFKIAMSMLASEVLMEEWKNAIKWFLKDEFWCDKIGSLKAVEKHFMKYQLSTKKVKASRDWLYK